MGIFEVQDITSIMGRGFYGELSTDQYYGPRFLHLLGVHQIDFHMIWVIIQALHYRNSLGV